MEILIILVVMVVVSLLAFMQLKGAKQEVMPAMSYAQKKSPKKQKPQERKEEKWDQEKKTRNASPEERKANKKRFDPVAEGAKVLKPVEETKTVRERKPKTEEEVKQAVKQVKQQKKKLVEEGFVMVEDKKLTAAIAPKKEDPISIPQAEKTEEQLKIEALRAIINGSNTNQGEKKPFDKPQLSNDEMKTKLGRNADAAQAQSQEGFKPVVVQKFSTSTKTWGKVPAAAPADEPETQPDPAAAPADETEPKAADEPEVEEKAEEEEPANDGEDDE